MIDGQLNQFSLGSLLPFQLPAGQWVDFPPALFHIPLCLSNLTQTRALLCLHQVALLGLDLLSALVSRLQERFRAHIGTGETVSSFWSFCHENRAVEGVSRPPLSPHDIVACLFGPQSVCVAVTPESSSGCTLGPVPSVFNLNPSASCCCQCCRASSTDWETLKTK